MLLISWAFTSHACSSFLGFVEHLLVAIIKYCVFLYKINAINSRRVLDNKIGGGLLTSSRMNSLAQQYGDLELVAE